jgi:cell wall-associated NlpC family hydrolase
VNVKDSSKTPSRLPILDPLDPRLNAIRSDLADIRLKSKFDAIHYASGKPGIVCEPVVSLKGAINPDSDNIHQLLMGEMVWIFEDINEQKWVQSRVDGYVGYATSRSVSQEPEPSPLTAAAANANGSTHIVSVPTTFCYPKAELRNPPLYSLSMGSQVTIRSYRELRGTKYAMLAGGGALIKKHLIEIDKFQSDYVGICESLLNTPYLWGGSSAFGIDCSSLVQLSMRMCGTQVLRDSDMQAATIGIELDAGENYQNLKRGDLIFWRGHVGVHQGSIDDIPQIIHSSGHTMNVASEPLHQAIERIAYLYESPIGFRRP